MAFVYVSNAVSGDISVLHMAGNGELSLQSPCQLAGSLAPMAISPGKKMLYVAQRGDLACQAKRITAWPLMGSWVHARDSNSQRFK